LLRSSAGSDFRRVNGISALWAMTPVLPEEVSARIAPVDQGDLGTQALQFQDGDG
jgi:hypothetical protein